MNKKTSLSSAIPVLGIVTFFILGCQAISQAAPAATSVPTTNALPPTSAPTKAFTPTAAAKADISSAVLTLEDFPAVFEQLSLEELGMSVSHFSSEGFQPEHVFVFFNSQNFQMIFGFNFLLDETFDRVSFDLGVSKPDVTIPAFVQGMGTENVHDQKALEGQTPNISIHELGSKLDHRLQDTLQTIK